MSAINDGGPAFPKQGVEDGYGKVVGEVRGMTLRDYFAAKALQGMIAGADFTIDIDGPMLGIGRAKIAYAMADAMLAARGKS